MGDINTSEARRVLTPEFVERVRLCAFNYCDTVLAESFGATHAQRAAFATTFLNNATEIARDRIAPMLAANPGTTGGVIPTGITDAQILAAIAANWDTLSGVTATS